MNEEKLRNKLWIRAQKEFEEFKSQMLTEDKEKIFESAFKISTLSEFTDMCDSDCTCLSLDEVKALLKEKYQVHTLYNYYMKTDAGSIEDLYESIWYSLSNLVDNYKQKKINKER